MHAFLIQIIQCVTAALDDELIERNIFLLRQLLHFLQQIIRQPKRFIRILRLFNPEQADHLFVLSIRIPPAA